MNELSAEWEKRIAEAQDPDELVAIGAQVKVAFDQLVRAASRRLAEIKAAEQQTLADTPEVEK
jgi:hypothetical protein